MPVAYNRLPQMAAAAKPLVEAALAKTAFDTETAAKGLAPVDTGALMNSISAAKERDLTWRVTAHAEYAIYVELGTRYVDQQPYLAPALNQTSAALIQALKVIA
jgi:HK97 gp10 family phage protein